MINAFERVVIGRDLEVPRFGLGCAHIAKNGEGDAVAIVRAAFERIQRERARLGQ